jgi:hypothetical protein
VGSRTATAASWHLSLTMRLRPATRCGRPRSTTSSGEALTVGLQNVPGAGADVFRTLFEANVNLEVFLPVRIFDDEFYAVICPDDVTAASAALGDQVVTS